MKNGKRARRSTRRRCRTHIWHFISCRVIVRERRRSLPGGPVEKNKRGRVGKEEGQQMTGRKTERFIPLPSLGSREGETFPSIKADLKGLIGRNSSSRGRIR